MTIKDAEGEELAARVYQAYTNLFAFAAGAHLLRVWNYLPRITENSIAADQTKMERYRHFNLGAAQSFRSILCG